MQRLPQQGDIIDNAYEIKQLLGQGGFGAVYLARQLAMDRDIALKLLVAQGPKLEEMVARFQREVMAIRNLCHPNTVRIFDFRNSESGLLYYTMEYLKGATLKDMVARHGAFSHERATHVVRQILKSLAEAHSIGIVHRDLKPANIMIVDMHGETDFVKVLDFGIAKIIDGDGPDSEDLTSAGVLVGTLRYMSPEQIAGDQLKGASDLYSLALITIEMLTGQSVFAGSGRWEVFQQQISPDPVAIPESVLRGPLGPVLQRALEKNPKTRYQSAEEMLADLDNMGSTPRRAQSDTFEDEYPPDGPTQSFDLSQIDLSAEVRAYEGQPTGAVEDDADKTLMHDAPGIMPLYGDGQSHTPPPEHDPGRPADERFVGEFGQAPKPTLDHGDFFEDEPPRNNALKVAGGLLALILVVGVAFVAFNSISSKDSGEPEPIGVAAVTTSETTNDNAAANTDDTAKAAEIKVIAVSTGEVTAKVFQDNKLLGTTPLDVQVPEIIVVRVKAEGYRDIKKVLRPNDEASLKLTMEPLEAVADTNTPTKDGPAVAARDDKSTAKVNDDPKPKDTTKKTKGDRIKKKKKTDDTSDPDWLAVPSGKKTKPKDVVKKPKDEEEPDWLAVPSSKKKKRKKKKKKKKDDVPLFD